MEKHLKKKRGGGGGESWISHILSLLVMLAVSKNSYLFCLLLFTRLQLNMIWFG
jgi:hypothetical protein